MTFNKDQTYFLVEAEKEKNKETVTKVELCMGGDMTITVGRSKLKSMGKSDDEIQKMIERVAPEYGLDPVILVNEWLGGGGELD